MFSKVKWRKFGGYSGPLIYGKKQPIPKNIYAPKLAMSVLTWVVETGYRFGTIVSYDGTGVTAGPGFIGVYPANPQIQGPVWPLISKIREKDATLTQRIDEEFADYNVECPDGCGWEITDKGVVSTDTKILVDGRLLREELTPNGGKVPKSGKDWQSAKGWALIFNELFENPYTHEVQLDFTTDYLWRNFTKEHRYLKSSPNQLIKMMLEDPNDHYNCLELMIAKAVWTCFFFHNPARAIAALHSVSLLFDLSHGTGEQVAREIIAELGDTEWKRWSISNPTGRYQRTRDAVKKIWGKQFVSKDGIMPKY